MAKTRNELLELFGTGNKLTAANLAELINSLVTTEESSTISGSLLPYIRNTFNLGSPSQPWKEIYVHDGSINFVDDNGLVTSFNKSDFEASRQDNNNRSLDTGFSVKRITSFNDTGSTFIDLNTTSRGVKAGTAIDFKIKETFEALHLSEDRISLGPTNNFPVEITGALDVRANSGIAHKIRGKVQITGEKVSGGIDSGFEVTGSLIKSGSGGVVTLNEDGSTFRGGNVVLENAIMAQPGKIKNTMDIGTPTSPAIANYIGTGNDDRMEIESNITVTVHPGSKMIIKSPQPNVKLDKEKGEITISDPQGISDIIVGQGSQGTNPQYINSNYNIPIGNYANWYGPIYVGRSVDKNGVVSITNNGSLRVSANAQLRIQSF